MLTQEDRKFLKNCFTTTSNIYNIIREYRHSYEADANEYEQLKNVLYDFHTNYFPEGGVEKFRDHLLDVMDFILDNKLKEFNSEDKRYKVWNSIYDCVRELYFGENS